MLGLDKLVNLEDSAVSQSQFYGVTVGVVTNIKDPDNLGRIKVKFPQFSDRDESPWARVVTLMAGKDRGTFFFPEVDDEVLVAFEQGDINFPYVIGALWNGKDKPPVTLTGGKNDRRLIKSRSGHVIELDDTKSGESIVIQTQGGHVIRLDDANGKTKIEIIDSSGKNSIKIDTKGNEMTVAAGKITIDAQQEMTLKSGGKITIDAQREMTLKSGGKQQIKGKMVEIN